MIRTRLHRFVMYTYTRTIKIVALIAGLVVPHALVDLKCIPLLTNFLEQFLQHGLSLVKQGMKEALPTFTSNIVTSTWLPTFLCPASLLRVVCFFCKVLGGLKDKGITQRWDLRFRNYITIFSDFLQIKESLGSYPTPRDRIIDIGSSFGWWSCLRLLEVVSGSMPSNLTCKYSYGCFQK